MTVGPESFSAGRNQSDPVLGGFDLLRDTDDHHNLVTKWLTS
jgi:hypothetical protein